MRKILIAFIFLMIVGVVKADDPTINLTYSQCVNYTVLNVTDNTTSNFTICAPAYPSHVDIHLNYSDVNSSNNVTCYAPSLNVLPAITRNLIYGETNTTNNFTCIAPPYPKLNLTVQFTWADLGIVENLTYRNNDLNLTVKNTPKPTATNTTHINNGTSVVYNFLQLKGLSSVTVTCNACTCSATTECRRNLDWDLTYGQTRTDTTCNITATAPPVKKYNDKVTLSFGDCYTNTDANISICAPKFPAINETRNLNFGETYDKKVNYNLQLTCPALSLFACQKYINASGCSNFINADTCKPYFPECQTKCMQFENFTSYDNTTNATFTLAGTFWIPYDDLSESQISSQELGIVGDKRVIFLAKFSDRIKTDANAQWQTIVADYQQKATTAEQFSIKNVFDTIMNMMTAGGWLVAGGVFVFALYYFKLRGGQKSWVPSEKPASKPLPIKSAIGDVYRTAFRRNKGD